MSGIFEYDLFLSFAKTDEKIVKPIWQEMCLAGLRVFWSDSTLKDKIGESWFEVIQSSLEQSQHFVLICSKTKTVVTTNWYQATCSVLTACQYNRSTMPMGPRL